MTIVNERRPYLSAGQERFRTIAAPVHLAAALVEAALARTTAGGVMDELRGEKVEP